MGFPSWLFMSVFDTGWTYGAAWAMTVANVAWVAVGGALLGVVFDRTKAGAAAS